MTDNVKEENLSEQFVSELDKIKAAVWSKTQKLFEQSINSRPEDMLGRRVYRHGTIVKDDNTTDLAGAADAKVAWTFHTVISQPQQVLNEPMREGDIPTAQREVAQTIVDFKRNSDISNKEINQILKDYTAKLPLIEEMKQHLINQRVNSGAANGVAVTPGN